MEGLGRGVGLAALLKVAKYILNCISAGNAFQKCGLATKSVSNKTGLWLMHWTVTQDIWVLVIAQPQASFLTLSQLFNLIFPQVNQAIALYQGGCEEKNSLVCARYSVSTS